MAAPYPHSIPTPPFSPHSYRLPDENEENPLKSTINLLDSLVAFYQHERMWVYRTRATLEQAFTDLPFQPQTQYHQGMDAGASGGGGMQQGGQSLGDPGLVSPSVMDTQYDDSGGMDALPPGTPGGQQNTRWMRRKKGFKLRLDGIRTRRVINTQQTESGQGEQLQPREQLLEMFEKMMESRMESCQRVNKLVRDANRARLHYS